MIIQTPKFTIEVDVEKTKAYYDTAALISEGCDCSGCRNYEKAIDTISDEVKSFFKQLGVFMKRATEVFVIAPNADGTMLYGGWYHVCGRVIDGESAWNTADSNNMYLDEEKLHAITDKFKVTYGDGSYPVPDNFPRPVLQLDIFADIPWVLEEKNDYL